MESEKTKFLVIGLGPVGGIFAAALSASGYSVTGVDIWEDHVDRIRRDGLFVEGLSPPVARLARVCTSLSELKDESFDYAMVAVKASVMPVLVPQLDFLTPECRVVSLQNGIDTEEFLGEHFGREHTMRAVVNFAGGAEGPGRLKMVFFNKPNYIGCLCSGTSCTHARELADIMTASGLDAEATADIKKAIWRKTILNAALAPVCALLDMTMADVMSCNETFHVVELILGECIKVARERGYEFGDGFLDFCLDYLSRGGAHKPSMLLDLQKGMATEIDYLNGKIVSHGIRLGVPVPVNTTLTAMIKAKEGAVIKERLNQTEGGDQQ